MPADPREVFTQVPTLTFSAALNRDVTFEIRVCGLITPHDYEIFTELMRTFALRLPKPIDCTPT